MCSVVGDAFALAQELALLQAIASWDSMVSSVSLAVYNRSS